MVWVGHDCKKVEEKQYQKKTNCFALATTIRALTEEDEERAGCILWIKKGRGEIGHIGCLIVCIWGR